MKLTAACAFAWLLWATPSYGAEAPAHGSREGKRDSRGPGAGDGRGDPRRAAKAEARAEEADHAEEVEELLGVDLGGGARIVPRLQYRVRYYHDGGRDFLPGGEHDFVRQRARLGMEGHYDDWLRAYLELQDVRTWGEESHPVRDFNADGFDLHQGYMQLGVEARTTLTIGRQKLAYLNERIVGALEWLEQGRSFDAARVTMRREGAIFDGGYALVRDGDADGAADGERYGKSHLGVWHIGHGGLRALQPNVLVVYEADSAIQLDRLTAGTVINGRFGSGAWIDYELEGYFQYGKRAPGLTHVANTFSLRTRVGVNYPVQPYLELWGTFVSGDDDPTDATLRTFDNPYPTAHKFHGEMDMFQALPEDTDGRGLRDFGTALGLSPRTKFGSVDARLAFHVFDANVLRADGAFRFGWETDLSLRGRLFYDHFGYEFVLALFVPDDLSAPSDTRESEQLAYVTLDAKF
jgi:hypothetical protein